MRFGSGIAGMLCLAVLASGAPTPAQEPAHHVDYRKCKICAPALAKAMAYLKGNLRSDKAKRVIGSKMGGYMMAGFAFMMEGESPKELEECVRYACQAIKDEGFNRNWYLSMSMIFLAEVASRYGFTPEVERALADGLKMAERQQEETGGWCHHLRMWAEDNYNKKGGGKDLGMVTAMIYAAMVELKAMGVTIGPVMERAQKNLETISDGMGVRYGTDNGVGDAAMARASWVLMALLGTGQTAHPLFAKYSKGLEQRYRRIEEGVHGFAPLHYFSVAAASHRMGPDFYLKFSAEYLDKLIATQMPEGVVPLHGEDDVASTAVFACLVMMQKPGIFRMPARKKAAAPPAGVKVTVDASQVPELQEWADQAKALCEEWYPKVSEFLATPGFAPPREMTIVFEKDKKGVADTSGNRIRVAADWIRKHPEDTGMIVHELVHVVQGYRNGGPGWLTEGIADYIRYFQYERKGITPRDLRRGSYKDGYRTAASFLAWTAQKHDKELIKKLHAAMRAGTGREELFKEWTGKDVETLWKEYLAAD